MVICRAPGPKQKATVHYIYICAFISVICAYVYLRSRIRAELFLIPMRYCVSCYVVSPKDAGDIDLDDIRYDSRV